MDEHCPDIAIIDINLERRFSGRNGVQLARELVAGQPGLKTLPVSGFKETAYESIVRTIRGAVFIDKAALSSDFLLDVLHKKTPL